MIKNLNKIIGFFLLCFQMSLLNAMVTPPEITKSYRDWLKDGNKGTMWNFIQQRMQGPSEVQAELKQSQNQITDLKALVETQEKQLKEQKRQLEQKMQLKPASDEEKQKLTRELQNSKAELEKVQKELESSKVLLSQSETIFATRTGGYDKAVKESQDEVEKLKTELARQKEAIASERKQFIDKLNENVRETRELIEKQKSALGKKSVEVEKTLQQVKETYANIQREQAKLSAELQASKEDYQKLKEAQQGKNVQEAEHEALKKDKEDLQKEIRKLIAENKKKVAEYERQLKELPIDLNVSNRDLASLREENNRLREALVVKDFEKEKIKQELSDYYRVTEDLKSKFELQAEPKIVPKTEVEFPEFHKLVKFGDLDKIKSFLNINGKEYLESPDKEGKTPLFIAVEIRRRDIVDFLIQQGAALNAIDGSAHSVLQYLEKDIRQDLYILKTLKQRYSEASKDKSADKLRINYESMQKILFEKFKLAEFLVEKGADLTYFDVGTDIYNNINEIYPEVALKFKIFLEKRQKEQKAFWRDLKVKLQTKPAIPSFTIAEYFEKNIGKMPLKQFLGRTDTEGKNLFHYCTEFGNYQFLDGYIKLKIFKDIPLGPYINKKDNKGNTALHDLLYRHLEHVVPKGELDIDYYPHIRDTVKGFLDNGADPNICNNAGKKSFDLANDLKIPDKSKLFLK